MKRRAVVATLLLSAILGASHVVAGGDETHLTSPTDISFADDPRSRKAKKRAASA